MRVLMLLTFVACSFRAHKVKQTLTVDPPVTDDADDDPIITSLTGDSATQPGRVASGFFIDGERFTGVTTVTLGSHTLAIAEATDTRLHVHLSTASASASGALVVTTARGSASIDVAIETGARGMTGPTGVTGMDGIPPPSCGTPGLVARFVSGVWTCTTDEAGTGGSLLVSVGADSAHGINVTSGSTTPFVALTPCPNGQLLVSNGTTYDCAPDDRTITFPVAIAGSVSVTNGTTPALSTSATLLTNATSPVLTVRNNAVGASSGVRVRSSSPAAATSAQVELIESVADFARLTLERASGADTWDIAARTDGSNDALNFYSTSDRMQITPTSVRVTRMALNGQPFSQTRPMVVGIGNTALGTCDNACGAHGLDCRGVINGTSNGISCAITPGDFDDYFCLCGEP